ncbi:hypothetical protein FUAX_08230 [Fulvitalea axinellae]|uniref:Lipoprotein n=1 Tax=Fulvitalea axinellae TaxID=1182444 RepID=A0AAU9C8E5_9BACT|nr:hypothetical protein FUAX_08230 [Fulvitalea axinellae]
MLKTIFRTTALALILVACGKKDKKGSDPEQQNTLSPEFETYLSKLPELPLPFETHCDLDSLGTDKVGRFTPEGLWPSGKLKGSDNHILVLYGGLGDYLYPFLYSFNHDGDAIDSLALNSNGCIGGESFQTATYSKINPDLTISLIDSTEYHSYVDENLDKMKLDSATVTKSEYKLDKNGKFVKL